jgi:TonB-linked SusC/RagA family outer membrane protein
MQYYLLNHGNCLKIMKITFSQLLLALILSGVAYSKSTNAQILDKIVSVTIKEPNLESALKVIERSAGVKFVYSKSVIQTNQQVSYTGGSQRLDAVLSSILPEQITYQLINDRIVLSNKKAASTPFTKAATQQAPIKGKVVSDKGEELVGVSVSIKGSTGGTITDINGNFTINNVEPTTVLVFKYIGFTTQEVTVGNQTTLAVTLVTQASNLSEVVVVGYNVVRRSDVTSSVVSVNAEEIRSRPVANALQAIQGKAAGVDITSNERPGEIGSIRIRGTRSYLAGNNPLYVVDGVPLDLRSGGIETVNPNDIETIDILKDASATAVYGSRGANGVVLVTTKRGKAGKLSLDYVGTATIESLNSRQEMMNSAQYIEFRRDAYRRLTYLNAYDPLLYRYTNGYPLGAPTQLADLGNGTASNPGIFGNDPYARANVAKGWVNGTFDGSLVPTTDWTGMVTKTGVTHDHVLSASGGTDKIKAYGSFGFLSQGGTQLGQDYTRYSAKVSVDASPTKWFSMGGSINTTFAKQNFGFATGNATGPGALFYAAQGMLPYAVPFDDNGNRINLPGGDVNIQNPIGEDRYNINLRKTTRALGSLYAEFNILKGLKYRINFGPDFVNNYNGRFQDQNSINRGAGQPGSTNFAQLEQRNRLSWTLDHLVYYNKSVGKHDIGLTFLQSSNSFREESSSMTGTKLPYNQQLWYQLNSVSALDAFGTGLYTTSLNSYMARLNYTFNGKYILTTFGRWDAASQLAEGNKWDFFPSLSLAWRLDQEEFIKQFSWVNQLKVRAGVGTVGNAAGIEAYSTLGPLTTQYYTFGSSVQPGYISSDPSANPTPTLANKNLGWEHTTQYNLGIDFGFLKNRINGSLDMYTSKTSDLLLRQQIASITGYTFTNANIGQTSNRGIELTVTSQNIQGKDFNWTSTFNFGANKDKVDITDLGRNSNIGNSLFIGQRIGSFYDYEKERIWQNTPEDLAEIALYKANGQNFVPGDIKVVDQNKDYRIDANNDRVIRGSSSPAWTGGISNTFNYKGVELSIFVYSRWKFIIPIGAESLQGRFAQRVVNYWTPTNPTNDYPSPNFNSAAGDSFRSAMNYQDGSFVKIRNITLGYFLPSKLTKTLGLSRVRVYAQVLNPGLIYSKIDWIDPDLYLNGNSNGSTFNRGMVFGVNVGF